MMFDSRKLNHGIRVLKSSEYLSASFKLTLPPQKNLLLWLFQQPRTMEHYRHLPDRTGGAMLLWGYFLSGNAAKQSIEVAVAKCTLQFKVNTNPLQSTSKKLIMNTYNKLLNI